MNAQVQVPQDDEFLQRKTPLWLWHYILAEAAFREGGERLGSVGSTIVAEVLVGLVRRSEGSILATEGWQPTLSSAQSGTFTLADLFSFARVLEWFDTLSRMAQKYPTRDRINCGEEPFHAPGLK
jgi:hypothetical protein